MKYVQAQQAIMERESNTQRSQDRGKSPMPHASNTQRSQDRAKSPMPHASNTQRSQDRGKSPMAPNGVFTTGSSFFTSDTMKELENLFKINSENRIRKMKEKKEHQEHMEILRNYAIDRKKLNIAPSHFQVISNEENQSQGSLISLLPENIVNNMFVIKEEEEVDKLYGDEEKHRQKPDNTAGVKCCDCEDEVEHERCDNKENDVTCDNEEQNVAYHKKALKSLYNNISKRDVTLPVPFLEFKFGREIRNGTKKLPKKIMSSTTLGRNTLDTYVKSRTTSNFYDTGNLLHTQCIHGPNDSNIRNEQPEAFFYDHVCCNIPNGQLNTCIGDQDCCNIADGHRNTYICDQDYCNIADRQLDACICDHNGCNVPYEVHCIF